MVFFIYNFGTVVRSVILIHMNDSYLQDLNTEQQRAVLHTNGPLLIVAGAGTGKTKTLTYRILHLINNGVPAENG